MEPGQNTHEPTRQGFWRRNRLPLLFFGSCLFATALAVQVRVMPVYGMAIKEGELRLKVYDRNSSLAGFYFDFARPRMGGAIRTGGGIEYGRTYRYFSLPIWYSLLCSVAWIATREWRRKRAAKGKACHQ